MGFYIRCPYYKSSASYGSDTIVCEDTHRSFGSFEKKNKQLETVCEKNWESCPYAIALNELYEREEGMNLTEREEAHLKHTCKAQKQEMAKLKKRLTLTEREKDKAARDETAALHLAKQRELKIKKLSEKAMLLEEEKKGLLALIGYMAKKSGITDFTLYQVQRHGRRYDTRYRVDTETAPDGVKEIKRVYIETLEKEKEE